MFRSTHYKIENRQGLEDQRVEDVMSKLASLGAPEVVDSKHTAPGQAHRRFELAGWLSDYHLVVFLDSSQLFSRVRGVLY